MGQWADVINSTTDIEPLRGFLIPSIWEQTEGIFSKTTKSANFVFICRNTQWPFMEVQALF